MKKLYIILISVICFVSLGSFVIFNFMKNDSSKKPAITIFIHGSYMAARYVMPKQYQSKSGLHSIDKYEQTSHFSQVADVLSKKDPQQHDKEHYYVFGWSGALSFKVRKKLAQRLYYEMKELLTAYKEKHGQYPHVQIITFSHGGNIALQLADLLPFFNDQEVVELELVLIGCPVQAATEDMIASPWFSHVSVIASSGDIIQRLDPHNLYGPRRDKKTKIFSRRFFDVADFDKNIQNKITQYSVTVNNKQLGHLDLFRSFMIHVPYVLAQKYRVQTGETLEIDIFDPDFIFNKIYNLYDSLQGKRKFRQ